MRKLFKEIHLWLSIPFGIFLSIICFSGATLVFEKEIIQMCHPHLYKVSVPKGDVSVLPPSQLIARIQEQTADSLKLVSLQYSGKADEAATATFKNAGRKSLSVNPYTGEVNGWIEGNAFFQTMRKLHRWLLNSPAQKGSSSVGKTIVGISTLMMVVILVSGLVIWWPRNRKALGNRLKVSCHKGWHRFWYDSHVALGFYSTLFLLVMALTGLTWSFGWYRSFAYGLLGGNTSSSRQAETSPSMQASNGTHEKKEGSRKIDYTAWDKAFQYARTSYTDYSSLQIEGQKIQISQSRQLRRTDTLKFHPKSGEITETATYADAPRAQKLRGWFYAFHTGSWGGIYTKVLYFLAAFIGGVLPLSGYYLWLKKKQRATR